MFESEKIEAAGKRDLIQFGRLERARELAGDSGKSAGLRPDAPVFLMGVDDAMFARHVNASAAIALGAIQAEECLIVTVEFQLGHALLTWLADPTDPEFWKSVDDVKRSRQIAFACEGDSSTSVRGFDVRSQFGIEKFRSESGKKGKPFMQEAMSRIALGRVPERGRSLIVGCNVMYSPVSILATRGVVRAAEKLFASFLDARKT